MPSHAATRAQLSSRTRWKPHESTFWNTDQLLEAGPDEPTTCHRHSDRLLCACEARSTTRCAAGPGERGRPHADAHGRRLGTRGSAPLAVRRQRDRRRDRGRRPPTPAATGGRAGSVPRPQRRNAPEHRQSRGAGRPACRRGRCGTSRDRHPRRRVLPWCGVRIDRRTHRQALVTAGADGASAAPRALSANPGARGLLRVEPQRDRAGPADRAGGLAGPDACRRAAVRGQDAHGRRGRRHRDALPGHRPARGAAASARSLRPTPGWTRTACA
jgi:hypothetical protein